MDQPTRSSWRAPSTGAMALGVLGLLVAIGLLGWWLSRDDEGVGNQTGATATARPTPRPGADPGVVAVSERPCLDSDFTCITLRVPRDHFADRGGATIRVTFALREASGGEAIGTFVTATGGPGSSGIAVADGYTAALDTRIARAYDIVFFDGRGVGASVPLACPGALQDYFDSSAVPIVSEQEAADYAAASRVFSEDCVEETGVRPAALETYGTRQAAEDLELFRRWLGAERLHLYGESYGSQFVQTYAQAHPDRVAALMLDGPVDLTLEGFDYYREQAEAFSETLVHTLEDCAADDACAADAGGDPLGTWDALAADLRDGPQRFEFVTAEREVEMRELTLADLEAATAGYLYSTYDQMLFQRAMGWAARGELLPLARLSYLSLGLDPETLEVVADPTYSDAMYYAVECVDYAFGSGDTEAREAAYLAAGREAGVASLRLGSIFYGDLPCVSWPAATDTTERPGYLTEDAYPTIILASTTDPATPYGNALRLFERAGDAYLVTQPGGPHVIFGRGRPCPDDLVTAFLLDGTLPDRETTCEEMGPDEYAALPPATLAEASGPLHALRGIDAAITADPDYWAWDGVEPITVGCLHGGSITYSADDAGYAVRLRVCEHIRDLPLTGRGLIDDAAGRLNLDLDGPDSTSLQYSRDDDGDVTLAGRWFGQRVSDAG